MSAMLMRPFTQGGHTGPPPHTRAAKDHSRLEMNRVQKRHAAQTSSIRAAANSRRQLPSTPGGERWPPAAASTGATRTVLGTTRLSSVATHQHFQSPGMLESLWRPELKDACTDPGRPRLGATPLLPHHRVATRWCWQCCAKHRRLECGRRVVPNAWRRSNQRCLRGWP